MHPFLILLPAVAIVLVGILVFRLHAFLALILAAVTVAVLTPPSRLEQYAAEQVADQDWTSSRAEQFLERETVGVRVAKAFGETCASIGILIAMAAIIGKCLLDSGGADRIVRGVMRLVGEARAGVAFVASGFLLGIPVFFDTVFYLMIPLGKATFLRTGKNYLFYVLTIVAGATMAHSLVPPTPGPLVVADQLDVNLISMIIGGTLVGLVASTAGYLFAFWLNRRLTIPLRTSVEEPLERMRAVARRDLDELPGLGMSLLPILLPVILIASGTAVQASWKGVAVDQRPGWVPLLLNLGDKNVALMLAAAMALALLVRHARPGRQGLATSLHAALASAGVIILITAAGGAFGAMVRQSGVAEEIGELTAGVQPLLLLPIAFLVTAAIRTSQGSATVAMVTAAGVLQGFADEEVLGFRVLYLALAIGCGSKPIAWMADSGFWVICKMSGMTESEGLRTVTPMSIVMGLAGLLATIAGALLWP